MKNRLENKKIFYDFFSSYHNSGMLATLYIPRILRSWDINILLLLLIIFLKIPNILNGMSWIVNFFRYILKLVIIINW